MIKVYGIKNCNTVKSALDWLKKNKVEFEFHDFRSKGVEAGKLKEWAAQKGWEALVNKRGTTWRQLDEATQKKVIDDKSAIALMLEKTSVIKRPLIERGSRVVALGFDVSEYEKLLGE